MYNSSIVNSYLSSEVEINVVKREESDMERTEFIGQGSSKSIPNVKPECFPTDRRMQVNMFCNNTDTVESCENLAVIDECNKLDESDKTFSCDVCEKTFAGRRHLKQHELIHNGEKPFMCEICNKGFTRKQH